MSDDYPFGSLLTWTLVLMSDYSLLSNSTIVSNCRFKFLDGTVALIPAEAKGLGDMVKFSPPNI